VIDTAKNASVKPGSELRPLCKGRKRPTNGGLLAFALKLRAPQPRSQPCGSHRAPHPASTASGHGWT
jgi:hypothetical protein